MKIYAVLFAPEFRLQAALRALPELRGKPAALLEVQGSKSRVAELNAAARARRVECGLTPTQAMSRCAELQLVHGNAGSEKSVQETLLQTAERLSPFLESTAPGAVTVELPREKTFSEEIFREEVVAPLGSLGLEVQVGMASTPELALLAARLARPVQIVGRAEEFLAPLPVALLQPSGEVGAVLKSWGIRTMGQFRELPMAQAGERLGREIVALQDRAMGGYARPLRLVRAPESFVEQADLEHPLEMLEPLLFLLRRFLEQIVRRLDQAYLVVGKLRLLLRFETGTRYRRVFTIPRATRDVDLLFRLLHTHLENFTSEAPIVGLELAAQPARAGVEQFGLLEKGLRDPHQFAETLARLQALLGPDRVGAAEPEASHHPEAFHLRAYNMDAPAPAAEKETPLGMPWLRFRPPVPARVIFEQEKPAYLYSARSTGAVQTSRGPWLLEGNWWESRRWAREEWDIAMEDGFYRLVRAEREWRLDGVYA